MEGTLGTSKSKHKQKLGITSGTGLQNGEATSLSHGQSKKQLRKRKYGVGHTTEQQLELLQSMCEHKPKRAKKSIDNSVEDSTAPAKQSAANGQQADAVAGVQQQAKGKKARKRKKAKAKLKTKAPSQLQSTTGKEAAMEYLCLWDTERSRWSFKKKTQFWLLQNMYSEDKVGG